MIVRKRDGGIVSFDRQKIVSAVQRCVDSWLSSKSQAMSLQEFVLAEVRLSKLPESVARRVEGYFDGSEYASVEDIQDAVILSLNYEHEYEIARHYTSYRVKHELSRGYVVPLETREAFDVSSGYFKTPLQEFQFYDKYSRFSYDLGRRETWPETVERTVSYLRELSGDKLPEDLYKEIYSAILGMEVMPSMRLLAMAGDAARRDNTVLYNCSYMPVDSIESFAEALLNSMSGCGVGFSVERKYIDRLPDVLPHNGYSINHVVEDTSEGWANALRLALSCAFDGTTLHIDYSKVRKAGSPLRVKGGQASGPEPLRSLIVFATNLIRSKKMLKPVDAHSIMCKVGGAAVAGGVRRTAMISLFDFDDEEMRTVKNGDLTGKEHLWNANNSAVWDRSLSQEEIIEFMMSMHQSKRGESGIFSRVAATERAKDNGRKPVDFGTNPCGEIVLRPRQFCNLSSAVLRESDRVRDVMRKVRLATIIGTIQSMATHFPNLSEEWKINCEEERLLGVDLNGIMDCRAVDNALVLTQLKDYARLVNEHYANLLGINPSKSITCIKPSGNSSTLLNTSSGIHARWSPYYIRNVRVSATSPIYKVLRECGLSMAPENGQTERNATTWVASFPVASPKGSVTTREHDANSQMLKWLKCATYYTEHNPSVTITYTGEELLDVITFVCRHQHQIGGMSFLPRFDASYEQMPYVEITEAEYEDAMSKFPHIDYSLLCKHDRHIDNTTVAQELACVSGLCEI